MADARGRLAQWRASRTAELTLPSGLVVTARRVGILDLVTSGQIPKPLLGMVDEVMAAGTIKITTAELERLMGLINLAVRAAVVDPPLADEPDDDHLGIHEIGAEDKLAVFNWMSGPAQAVVPFRAQPGGAVAAGPGGDALQQPAVGGPGD